jgi:transcriptional regulator with XRE-family HTH domain
MNKNACYIINATWTKTEVRTKHATATAEFHSATFHRNELNRTGTTSWWRKNKTLSQCKGNVDIKTKRKYMLTMFKKDAIKTLKAVMEAKRIWTYEVAKLTGYTRQYVSNTLCGHGGSDRAIIKICKVLGVDYKKLLK